jgi:hypothetical protein
MKLEFLESGSPDCPLIRLYEFNAKEAYELRRIALQLAKGKEHTIFLHEQPGMISIGGCELTLQQEDKDRGASEISSLKFKWVLSQAGWLQVAGLIRPFSQGANKGWQWLSEVGKVRILLSVEGSW